ncbi:MAG: hypothetical protein ACK2UH_03665 [Candidatus Promineifilaceae bacterium]
MMVKKVLLLTVVSLIAKSGLSFAIRLPLTVPVEAIIETQESCAQPSGKMAQTCRELEQRILAATVRIELQGWTVADDESGYDIDYTVGHATVRDGRYLITHNHFRIPLSIRLQEGTSEVYTMVTLSDSSGQTLFKGPISDFEIAWEDPETLVFAYKDEELFQDANIVSAEVSDWSSIPLKVGMEVAQVDWDGATTRVDWTTVQEVDVEDGVPRLVLADGVTLGASGGGIFWQGIHIANNWLSVQYYGNSGTLTDTTTKVALNSTPVSGKLSQGLNS